MLKKGDKTRNILGIKRRSKSGKFRWSNLPNKTEKRKGFKWKEIWNFNLVAPSRIYATNIEIMIKSHYWREYELHNEPFNIQLEYKCRGSEGGLIYPEKRDGFVQIDGK